MANDTRKDDSIKRIIQIGESMKSQTYSSGAHSFGEYLANIKRSQNDIVIKPLSLMCETLEVICSNKKNFKPQNYEKAYQVACNIYNLMFYHQEETPNFESLRIVFLELFEEDGILSKNLFNKQFYDCFSDKQNMIRFYQGVKNNLEPGDKWNVTVSFATEIRKLFFDDNSFMAALRSFVLAVQNMPVESLKSFSETETEKLFKMNGIYNVSAADLAEADMKLAQIKDLVERAAILMQEIDANRETIQKTAAEATNTLKETIDLQTEKLQSKLREENENVKNVYNECLNNINKSVKAEIVKSTGNFIEESRAEIDKLSQEAKQICANAAVNVSDLNSNADNVIAKVKTAVIDDEAVTKIIENSEKNKIFLEKINTISAMPTPVVAVAANAAPSVVATQAPQVMSVNMEKEETAADLTPIELLDKSIPFSERYEKAMVIKNNLIIEKGESFHEKFDDVLIAVMENTNPYLIGPSGCGKTYLIKQIGEVLGLSRTDIGYINEEYDILGFQTASGSYSKPNFYRCYKYGGIAFCDELDNGNSRASVKLNSFLSNTDDAYFCFPNGELVPRHPNFRFVSAGNTDGNGANMNYNSREKIEESVMQRLLPIYVGYDNRLEKSILKDYPDWFEFVCLFRNATSEWQNLNGVEASGIITTRDTSRIKQYLDNNSFNKEAIVKYEFIQTKNLSYLTFLEDYMKKNNKSKNTEILNIFINLTEQYKRNGAWNR